MVSGSENAPRRELTGAHAPEREIILVLGKTGMGKTRWTKRYLTGAHRLLILDPQLEYDGPLFESVDGGADHEQLLDYLANHRAFRARVPYTTIQEFAFLCRIVYHVKRCTFVVDEAQRVLPESRSRLPRDFEHVLYRGRHARVTLVLIAQRASTVNIAPRSQWTRIISFRQTEPPDIKWIESQAGEALPLDTLNAGEYIEIRPSGSERRILPDQWQH